MTPTLFSYLPAAAAHAICKLAEPQPTPTPTPSVPNKSRAKSYWPWGSVHSRAEGPRTRARRVQEAHGQSASTCLYAALAAPVIGAGLGLAYNMAKARQLEETQRAVQDRDH